ncbi:MAG: lipid-A-disaccharide synthase [Gammaproteobacteria bacterium RIFCSPHIGHO2_12_FULL_38_11]|nr:MAG: lipid-A-disaccharide synthase [Gammaproteobacteria bacterium RIFCSPHIGHO2_12_FULL_38_11]
MPNIHKKIFISAGEPSGDLLGANLAQALLKKDPTLQLTGMGSDRMKKAGVSIQFNSEKLAIVGLAEVITHLPSILLTWHKIKKYLQKTKPDLLVLIDFPDTHFNIMKYAKKIGIPVLYYVSPQIWAWRPGRIKQIKKYVDHMAVLFSFEEKIYRDATVPVTFVGHPLGDLVKPIMSLDAAYAFFKLNASEPVVTLFPGSRNSELKNHLPVILESAKQIRKQKPNTQFVLVLADHFNPDDIKLPDDIKIIQKNLYDLLQITTAAIAVSGTVTLEIALMQVPLCVIYKFGAFTFWLAKKLIKVKNIALCNIVSEKTIAKEFIQDDATPNAISTEILKLLSDKAYYEHIKSEFSDIKNRISIPGKNASERVAEIAENIFSSEPRASASGSYRANK